MGPVYPNARIDDGVESLAGLSFSDPYHWLEMESEEVLRWQRAQAQLASAHVRDWPLFNDLERLIEYFDSPRYVGLPRYAGGRWFRTHGLGGNSQVVVADEPMGTGRVLFDSCMEHAERPFLSWIAPSPDGRTLAVGVCNDGSENNTIRLIDVSSGEMLIDPPRLTLMDNWTGGVQWLPDSNGFIVSAITGAAGDFDQQVFLHGRLPSPYTVLLQVPWVRAKDYRTVVVSRDGCYLVALERLRKPIPVAVAALDDREVSALAWRPFMTNIDGSVAGHVVGGRYVAVTDVGAPRGRLVSIALDAADPNDHKAWRELIPESDAVLRTVTPIGRMLYITEFVDSYARVRVVDLEGRHHTEVPLPGRGAIVSELPFPMTSVLPKGHPEQFLFAFSTLTVSPGIYRYAPDIMSLDTLLEPRVRIENSIVESSHAISADGTRIPYRIVRRADVDNKQPRPALIWAYGGFNLPFVPQFPGSMAAFIALGGVFVHAHLRGGSEFGADWWAGGRGQNKQNCYDDLYAIADDLIEANRTTPELLAVAGASNGGLMAGVAVTQRPDLWAVVVPRVPLLDLIGHCRYPYGRMMMEELANVEDPDDVRRLSSFSPYHLVRDGIVYPAVFLEAGDSDRRCPAWHARKFAARLQRATAGSAPVLLHVWEKVGHGFATDNRIALSQSTEWLAFTLRHLGIDRVNPSLDQDEHSGCRHSMGKS